MDAVRVLLVVLCLAVAGRRGLPDRSALRDGSLDGAKRHAQRDGQKNAKRKAAWDAKQGEEAIVQAAQNEIGIAEVGDNAGPRVDAYNAYAGLRKVPWCASFVSWCHGQAGLAQPRTAWSPALFPAGRLSKAAVRGGVIGIYYPHLKRIGHCGIAEHIRNDLVYSIEGNTNVNGGREGNGVFRKIRHQRTIRAYALWTGNQTAKNQKK